MKQTSIYNNISKKLLAEAQLKKGEVVEFHLIAKRAKRYSPGNWHIPMKNIPSTDTIYDPHDDGLPKQIAAIKRLLPNDECELMEIFVDETTRPIPGALVFNGDNPKDRELYTYIYLSNFWDREDRDESRPLILRRVQPKEEARKNSEGRRKLVEAASYATNMAPKDVRAFAGARGRDMEDDIQILRDFVEECAVNDPVQFLHEAKSNRTKVKSTVRRAANLKKIYWEAKSSSWRWTDTKESIVSIPRNKDRFDYFVTFILEHENGPRVLDSLESVL